MADRRGLLRTILGGGRAPPLAAPVRGAVPPERTTTAAEQGGGAARTFEAARADVSGGLPSGTALLVVTPVSEGFILRGACCCAQTERLGEVYGKPALSLAALVAPGGVLPVNVLEFMQTWSRPMTELTLWLNERLHRHGGDLKLVIWDDSGYQIPWELFWLSNRHGEGEGWLGGLVTVTRWLSIKTAWPEKIRAYSDAHVCTGPVATFIDEAMDVDHGLFEPYRVEPSASMRDLARALRSGEAGLSLVYVACHGEYGASPRECTLGTMPLVHIDNVNLARLSGSATFVFLNACHSGALGYDTDMFNDRVLRGFSEVFLRSGAAGVLATQGAVGDKLAHQLAGELLRHLGEHPGLSVAEALRAMRAKAAGLAPIDLPDAAGAAVNREILPLLYRFMYVYYGSPATLISPELRVGEP
ncbi:CHAT domain-containing protein [Nonomuraea endophytica]|uniref:CHAT domain-containing protein n=1 Tax=Nonomuraea endophytica TaxID=714136 RepID=A0A7W8ABI3_9ACTN|nr:CHAT domain-containing protein [Nonomuraea endophytica]MBB5083068.1 hypothetical protein [Nonomuraea endophytica]